MIIIYHIIIFYSPVLILNLPTSDIFSVETRPQNPECTNKTGRYIQSYRLFYYIYYIVY